MVSQIQTGSYDAQDGTKRYVTDVIADMLTRIRNAGTAKHETVDVPASNVKNAIAKILLDEIREGKSKYHFIEVMGCPGGCVNGGGQPRSCDDATIKEKRAEGLYTEDKNLPKRRSHENADIIKFLYTYFIRFLTHYSVPHEHPLSLPTF